MAETTRPPFDMIAALAFLLGAVVVAFSLGSLLLTLSAVAGLV